MSKGSPVQVRPASGCGIDQLPPANPEVSERLKAAREASERLARMTPEEQAEALFQSLFAGSAKPPHDDAHPLSEQLERRGPLRAAP